MNFANETEIQVIGVFVHGILAGLHALGVFYNLGRRNWLDSVIHGGALAYDARSAWKHIETVRRLEKLQEKQYAIKTSLSKLR